MINEHIKQKDFYYRGKTIEVIDYVKDFVTGKVETLKKIKPVGASVKTCLLELFDLRGNKIKESLSHNIVNEFQNRQAFSAFFYDLIRQNGVGLTYKNPFTNLILTDYDGVENANELGLRGEIIGWANKSTPYSGADTLRGTINLSESETADIKRTGLIKTVFDFPTHAANGEIKSIWWMYGSDSSYKYHGYPYWAYNNNPPSGDWACDGDYIYSTNGGTILRYNMNGSVAESSIDFSAIDTDVRGIDFDGTYFWLIGNTSKKVYKCNASFQVQAQWVAADVTETVTSITMHNNKIFIATNTKLYRYDTVGAFEIAKDAMASYGLSLISRAKANDSYFMMTGINNATFFCYLDGNGDLVFKNDVSSEQSGWQQYCFVRNISYNNSRLLIGRVATTFLGHFIIGGIGAHTKLAVPVTKTNANPMKVTYTFDIELENALTW